MTTAAPYTLRVTVTDAWDTVRLDAMPEQTVAAIKTEAVRRTLHLDDASGFEVKFRGALILDESRTLEQVGVPSGGALIVLAARRRPVR